MKMKRALACLLLAVSFSVATQPVVSAQNGFTEPSEDAGQDNIDCEQSFLTLPPWYKGLATGSGCSDIKSPNDVGGIGNFIWIIALNIVEIMLRLAGYASVAFIIYGGYKYMISAGSADGVAGAKKTILNAVVGLVISIAAVAIVRTVSIGLGLGG